MWIKPLERTIQRHQENSHTRRSMSTVGHTETTLWHLTEDISKFNLLTVIIVVIIFSLNCFNYSNYTQLL